jgi:transposase
MPSCGNGTDGEGTGHDEPQGNRLPGGDSRGLEGRLSQEKAALLMGLGARQVRRLCRSYERHGPTGLASRKRGRPSNWRLPEDPQLRATAIVRELYGDFGPTLAQEKLLELHGVRVAKETLRKWMAAAGIWLTRAKCLPEVHQPRYRRACLGELVQSWSRSTAVLTRGSRTEALVARCWCTSTTQRAGSWSYAS